MIEPINDNLLVEVEGEKHFVSSEEVSKSGIVVDVSKFMTHYGSFGWAFENSFLEDEKLAEVTKRFHSFIGKRVYWEEHSDRGMTIEHEGKKYALIRFSKVIAVEDVK